MTEPRRGGFRRFHVLGFLPAVGMMGGILFANRVRPLVFGLPFLFFWIAAWVVSTSLVMWVILRLDRAHERRRDRLAANEERAG